MRGLALLGALALAEWFAAGRAFRSRIDEGDWQAALAALPADEPIFMAERWLEPAARMHLPPLAQWRSAAAPDLRGAPRFHVLGLDASWSADLDAMREELPPPRLLERRDLGALTLYTYEIDAPRELSPPLAEDSVELRVDQRRCSGKVGDWRCTSGRVRWRSAEIDYRPRRCLVAELLDEASLDFHVPAVTLGDTLRGHVGFDDFNARLRSDAVVRLEIELDGVTAGTWIVGDDQGWMPFAVRVANPGVHDLHVRLRAPTLGTWSDDGYGQRPGHFPCLELRSFDEEAVP